MNQDEFHQKALFTRIRCRDYEIKFDKIKVEIRFSPQQMDFIHQSKLHYQLPHNFDVLRMLIDCIQSDLR